MRSSSLSPVAVPAMILAVIAAISVSIPGYSGADETSSEPDRVAMAADLRVFPAPGNSTEDLAELQAAMRRGAEQQWSKSQLAVRVLSVDELEQIVATAPLYEGTLDLARGQGEMGIEAYNRVQTEEAVYYLERSLANFETISHDIVAPEEAAKILMYLALSYLEDGTNVVRPLEVFQDMIRRDPTRGMETGFYRDFIVQYYESARETLWRSLREDGPPIAESRRIAGLLDAEYVFHGYVIPTSEGRIELLAYLYDAVEDEVLPGESMALETLDEESLREGFSRLASRLSVCLVEPREPTTTTNGVVAAGGTSRLSLQFGMVYGSYMQVPTPVLEPFGNYGMGLGFGWSVTQEFDVIANLQVANSMRDYSGVLRTSFTTLRAMAGGQIGRRFGPVFIGIGAGLEVARIGPIQAFTDRSCLPDPDRLCPGETGTAIFDDHGLHWGVQVRPRVSWRFSDSFELSSALGVGYYFSPIQDRLLNFPITGEFGIHYRF